MRSAEGYQEAAEHFQSEADVEPGDSASTLLERMEVREAIHSGKIENAVQLINSHFPGLLLSNDELRFQLQACTGTLLRGGVMVRHWTCEYQGSYRPWKVL